MPFDIIEQKQRKYIQRNSNENNNNLPDYVRIMRKKNLIKQKASTLNELMKTKMYEYLK